MSRTAWVFTTIGVIVGSLVILGWISTAIDGDSGSSDDGNSDDGITVRYRVSDSADANVSLTYENAGGNSQQESSARTPWTRTYTMERGDFVYVSAQRGGGNGTVRCSISVNGDVIEEAQSTGDYVIATCSGSVP